jgi:ADP-ribosylglycohydrolase
VLRVSQPGGQRSRARGALYGLAIGDALGMPTQSLSRAQITARFGSLVTGFAAGPADHPLAAGLPAGRVTDDTEQAAMLGRLTVETGAGDLDAAEFARRLVVWEEDVRARGSLDLLGPSTQRAVAALLAGTPAAETGRHGTTNGAAMRIAPVGIATPVASPAGLAHLVDRVVAASQVTHNTGVALAGAAAIAAAVSAGLDGATPSAAISCAIAAARLAAVRGHWVAAADVASRIEWATRLVAGLAAADVLDVVYRLVGTSLQTQESVPAAFAVLAASPDPWLAVRLAASLGGDCDTIAAMAGAMAGACHGVDAFPAAARQTIDRVNADLCLGLDELADGLLAARTARAARAARAAAR